MDFLIFVCLSVTVGLSCWVYLLSREVDQLEASLMEARFELRATMRAMEESHA